MWAGSVCSSRPQVRDTHQDGRDQQHRDRQSASLIHGDNSKAVGGLRSSGNDQAASLQRVVMSHVRAAATGPSGGQGPPGISQLESVLHSAAAVPPMPSAPIIGTKGTFLCPCMWGFPVVFVRSRGGTDCCHLTETLYYY